jgi:hypothetical protein
MAPPEDNPDKMFVVILPTAMTIIAARRRGERRSLLKLKISLFSRKSDLVYNIIEGKICGEGMNNINKRAYADQIERFTHLRVLFGTHWPRQFGSNKLRICRSLGRPLGRTLSF